MTVMSFTIFLFLLLPTTEGNSPLSIHDTATKFSCPETSNTPMKLMSLSEFRGNGVTKYILLSPTDDDERQLCTLTRVDNEFNNVYVPIARSHSGNDWHRVQGKYLTDVTVMCGESTASGLGYEIGEYLCQVTVPPLGVASDGYYLTKFMENAASNRTKAARFLERTTWGATWEEITALESEINRDGTMAFARWVHNQVEVTPTSHRAFFRRHLNPRTVESYQYGIPGPKACEKNARFRRFAFTYKDVELSRGHDNAAGGTGLPFTPMEIETITVSGVTHYAVKFGGEIRSVLSSPLRYKDGSRRRTLRDGKYTICSAEEVAGTRIGAKAYTYLFQVLVGDLCTSSYTQRGGEDGKGDGSLDTENIRVNGELVRVHDSNVCSAKCEDTTKVKFIISGNPEIFLPALFDMTTISWIDLSGLASSELVNVNSEQTHDSSWLLKKDLVSCRDHNGVEILDPAGLANTDYSSKGRGKYNLDRPIFAKLPNNKWALHDMRTLFRGNTLADPMIDSGGGAMKRAARSGSNDDGDPATDMVTRCSNAQRNVFNEASCKISYHPDACVSVPLPDPLDEFRVFSVNPGEGSADPIRKYTPSYAGPDNGGVVVCGSDNEVAPDPMEDDSYDVINRKVQSHRVNYFNQKRGVWVEVSLSAEDQLCQKMGWALLKIFATSTDMNSDAENSETNINVLDNFITSCFATYREVMKKVSFNDEMSEQLTFLRNKAVHTDWHRAGKMAWPDENYARENLQLHSIGLVKLHDDGIPVIDRFGKMVANYEQKHIFTSAKIWTGFVNSFRRGNYEDQDWATASRLDPLVINDIASRDWFPKIDLNGGYIGDLYPLCSDLPSRHFLKKNAQFRLLGGSSLPLYHEDPANSVGDEEVHRLTLDRESSQLYRKLCNPKSSATPDSSLLPGIGSAVYNSSFGAPFCQGSNAVCDSSLALLQGRVKERNRPNTIDECSDGTDPNRSFNEAVVGIVIESVKGASLRGGELVTIKATIRANSKFDRVDFYYSSSAVEPNWKLITIVAPTTGLSNPLKVPFSPSPEIRYILPKCSSSSGCQQAVRVVLRSGRNPDNPSSSKGRSKDGNHKPNQSCPQGPYDDVDDLVFDVLPSWRPQDMCDFQTMVTLNENLSCDGRECLVDTVRVVEVVPGVFYEYLHVPCVHLPFYDDPVKVFTGWNGPSKKNAATMCANKKLPSALSTCCGSYGSRQPESSTSTWADVLSEYRFERVTFAGNLARCEQWGRTVCDPKRIGPFSMWSGQCLHRQSCLDVNGGIDLIEEYQYHWTDSRCSIQVKVLANGMLAIVHNAENEWPIFNKEEYPDAQSHVNSDKTVSYFYVQWNDNNVVAKLEYPNPSDNGCDGGTILKDNSCLCDIKLDDTAVFGSKPSKSQIFTELKVGAFDPTMFDDGVYVTLEESKRLNAVSVYKKVNEAEYSTQTVFRVRISKRKYLYFKNVRSVVRVCNGAFSFRNSPTFYDIVDPEVISAYHETEAYLDFVNDHPSTPPFVCKALLKYFGYSNPLPHHVKACSTAFKAGTFTFADPRGGNEILSYGDGRRGNLAAVAASIVLNNDALSPATDLDPGGGGIKSPLLKLMQVMRSFKLKRTPHHRRTDGLLGEWTQTAFGESPYGVPDQFSFYNLDYLPAGRHREAYLFAPEAELLNMGFVVASQNGLYSLIQSGLSSCEGGIGPDWGRGVFWSCGNVDGLLTYTAAHLDFAPTGDLSSKSNVVGQLATILTADRINPANRALIEGAYAASYYAGGADEALRVAQILMVSIPEFHTTNKVIVSDKERTPTPQAKRDETVPYKAIVSINLFGGMDSMTMLTPHPDGCQDLYDEYKNQRGKDLYLERNEMVKIDATTSEQPCTAFGVNKHLSVLAEIYNAQEGLFWTNIGHLQKPVDKHNYLAETTTQLFSHHTMKEESFKVDAFNDRGNTGILGRMSDVLGIKMAAGQTSIDRSLTILLGDPSQNRNVDVITNRGTDKFYRASMNGSNASDRDTLISIMRRMNSKALDYSSIHANLWSQSFIDSQTLTEKYHAILNEVESSSYIPRSDLGKRLDMIYRLIKSAKGANSREKNCDAFACEMQGFDQHFSLKAKLNPLFDEINDALNGFRKALIRSRLWDKVTVILHSEFGRSITPNASGGTDHGWGGNYFMMGGKVKGGKILGHHPKSYLPEDPHNTGRGVWIPTTANEAMWHGVTQWFGITDDLSLNYVLPNLPNFGCEIYSVADLYVDGAGGIPGCGGDVVELTQVFLVDEPRLLTPDEQVRFCAIVRESMRFNVRCIIQDQQISASDFPARRDLNEYEFILGVEYVVTSDERDVQDQIVWMVNTDEFQDAAASILHMKATIQSAVADTKAPTSSPTFTEGSPSKYPTPAPTGPTVNPTKDPTFSPSSKPTQKPLIESFYGYEIVGDGKCQDSHPFLVQTYDHLSLKSYSLPDDCAGVCAPCRAINGFRGFEWVEQECKCLFDRGTDLGAIAAGYGGSATINASDESAQGSIVRVVPKTDGTCYKVVTIVAPEEVDGFEYVGYGHCLDDSNLMYQTVIKLTTGGYSECGSACHLVNNVRGFWMQNSDCHCLRDGGNDDSGAGNGGNGGSDDSDDDKGVDNSNSNKNSSIDDNNNGQDGGDISSTSDSNDKGDNGDNDDDDGSDTDGADNDDSNGVNDSNDKGDNGHGGNDNGDNDSIGQGLVDISSTSGSNDKGDNYDDDDVSDGDVNGNSNGDDDSNDKVDSGDGGNENGDDYDDSGADNNVNSNGDTNEGDYVVNDNVNSGGSKPAKCIRRKPGPRRYPTRKPVQSSSRLKPERPRPRKRPRLGQFNAANAKTTRAKRRSMAGRFNMRRRAADSGATGGRGPIAKSDYLRGHCYKIKKQMAPIESRTRNLSLNESSGNETNQTQRREQLSNITWQWKRLRQHKTYAITEIRSSRRRAGCNRKRKRTD